LAGLTDKAADIEEILAALKPQQIRSINSLTPGVSSIFSATLAFQPLALPLTLPLTRVDPEPGGE
jgi:hypothetical protein